uniref:Uncharacterized protein n=1 Tax=Davidia involucrata TaxID=16924 RepID=A0A5B7B497_DAVIN
MGTEVLRPQDCLIERIRIAPAVFNRRRTCYGNGNGNPRFRKPVVRPEFRPDQKKRFNNQSEPSISKRPSSSDGLKKNQNSNLVMGHVTILRRGESIDSKMKGDQPLKKNGDDFIVCGTQRLGPDPEMVPKQIRIEDLKSVVSPVAVRCRSDVYAGSAFSVSPSPKSLPLPSFFNKKQQVSSFIDDSATRDLRRLLGLD